MYQLLNLSGSCVVIRFFQTLNLFVVFFFTDPATTEIYTLSLHDALPIYRLVIDPKVIQKDYDSVQSMPPDVGMKYMLTYQMTRITKVRGALAHDDRLDVLAMAVQYWVDQMAADADTQIRSRKEELLELELDKFMSNLNVSKEKTVQQGWIEF